MTGTGPAQGCLEDIGVPAGRVPLLLLLLLPLSEGWPLHSGDTQATAPLSAGPATASGTFNPLCKVLCILQSLYLCSIGPMSVFCLATDTHCTSNCSPKPLYSWMLAASTLATTAQRWVYRTVSLCGRPFQGLPWCNGSQWHCCPLHSPQHQLRSTKAVRKWATAPLGVCGAQVAMGIPFGMSQVLPVHSPLLRQSLMLAVPPLSDMLKFGGSFSVSQVTSMEPSLWRAQPPPPVEGRLASRSLSCVATLLSAATWGSLRRTEERKACCPGHLWETGPGASHSPQTTWVNLTLPLVGQQCC